MPADLADHAAALAAGYFRVQGDRGVGKSPRFYSRYEKPTRGDSVSSGGLAVATGTAEDQTTADTKALLALNGFRRHRFGTDATNVNKGRGGNTLTTDA